MPPRVAAFAALAAFAAPCIAAQGWIPPQPPCDVKAGHFRVNSAVINLQTAATKPNTRERMLRQTLDVLTRAIIGDRQDQNPGAWYYLGRYYVEMHDAAGADTAFRRAEVLAPQCKGDIDGYRAALWTDVVAAGLRNWQEGRPDSAKLLLRQAGALRPQHPRPFVSLGQLFDSENQLDSAAAYLGQAATAAGSDTAFADIRREALGGVARLHLRRVQADAAAQKWQRTRFSRDSLQRLVAGDSAVLARMEASAASRRARGARLAPGDQQAFTRDSSGRAQAVAARRSALAGLVSQVGTDSAAAAPVLGRAIDAFRAYVTEYPDATDALGALASLMYQAGRALDAVPLLDGVYPQRSGVAPDLLIEAGTVVLRANLWQAGATLLARGLEQRPYHRDGLADLATAYQAQRDSARMLPVAQRLATVDPLNRATLRLLAGAWDLRGRRDSAQKYRDLADGGMQVEVAVSTFLADSAGYTLAGVASNAATTPAPPRRLTFEFLDVQGVVRATQVVEIPAIPPQGTAAIDVRIPGRALVAWRYRPS